MTSHSKLSPSARVRWSACPGSVRESARYPEQPSGPAAIDGTHSHTLLDKCLNTIPGVILDPMDFVGQVLSDHEGPFEVDRDRAKRVKIATGYINERMAVMGSNAQVVELFAETRVYPDSLVLREDMSGTVDVRLMSTDELEIIDYKDGMNPVPAEHNLQLEQYAVGAVAGLIDRNQPLPKTVRMTIVQPKLVAKGMSAVSIWVVTIDHIMAVKDRLIAEAAATDAPDAPLVPGEEQCKYCAHKGACSALRNKVMADSGVSFKAVDMPQAAADKDPTKMSDAELVQILESAPLLRQMLEAAEAEALRRLEIGPVNGIKLVRGRGSRAWAYDEAEMENKLKKFGIPKASMYETKLVSPAKAEKLVWKKADKECQLSEIQIKRLGEYVKTTDGKPVVALASDPRKEVVTNASGMFPAVVAEDAITSWLF